MTEPDVEVVVNTRAVTGEGPVWDAGRKCLCWVDIPGKRYHEFEPASGHDRVVDVDRYIGAIALRENGGMIAAVHDGVATFDRERGAFEMMVPIESDKPGNRMNDALCDPAGRFWAGTMGLMAEPDAGALYRVDADLSVTTMLSPVTISNGMGWSPDGATMYYIDSPKRCVDVFDFDVAAGTISHRDQIAIEGKGIPDGMTVDSEGYLWVALYGGGCVRRYSPKGELDMTVEIPVSQVTSCGFGGDDLADLYITTASNRMTTEQLAAQPLAGSLFRCRPGPTGRLPNRFAG